MSTITPQTPGNYEDFPDGPGHIPDKRLSRAVAVLLVGVFLLFVLLVLMGA